MRHHGEGSMEESLRRHLEASAGIWKASGKASERYLGSIWETSGKHLRSILEALGGIWGASGRHLGGIWRASGRHLGGIWGAFGRHLVAGVAMGGQSQVGRKKYSKPQ